MNALLIKFFMKQNVICRSKKKRKKFKKKSEKQAESISTLCDTMRKQIINRFENVFTMLNDRYVRAKVVVSFKGVLRMADACSPHAHGPRQSGWSRL